MTSHLRFLVSVALLGFPFAAGCPSTETLRDAGRDAGRDAPSSTLLDVAIVDAPVVALDSPVSSDDANLDAFRASDAPSGGDASGDAPNVVSRICGGRTGVICGRGQFCNIPPENLCGAADGTGVCAAIPALCTRELNPQCGCDGMTYDNPCMAAMAGVSIARAGACRVSPAGSCDARRVTCARLPPTCTRSQAPSVVDGCWGPCVAANTCTCTTTAECPSITGFSEVCYRSGLCGPAL